MMETGCSMKVVLAGDHHEDRILLGEVFSELRIEFNLSMFQNGLDFLHYLEADSAAVPDLVFQDWNMLKWAGSKRWKCKEKRQIGAAPDSHLSCIEQRSR